MIWLLVRRTAPAEAGVAPIASATAAVASPVVPILTPPSWTSRTALLVVGAVPFAVPDVNAARWLPRSDRRTAWKPLDETTDPPWGLIRLPSSPSRRR